MKIIVNVGFGGCSDLEWLVGTGKFSIFAGLKIRNDQY